MTASLKNLKKAYNKALKENEVVFSLNDSRFLTSYASYLINYLETIGIKDNETIHFYEKEGKVTRIKGVN
jgi:hypothetical protein